jgi:uncharacterized membrane protein YbhN (UPF0104 family)
VQSLGDTAANLLHSPRARRWLQVLTISIVLIFFALALYSLAPQLLSYNWVLDPGYFALAVILAIARGPLGAYGWWAILRRLGYTIPFGRSIRIVYYSNLTGYVPAPMLHVVSRVYLAEQQGVPRVTGLVSIGTENVLVLLTSIMVAALSLLAWRDAPIWAGLALLAGLLLLVLNPKLVFRAINWLLVRLGKEPVQVELLARDMLVLIWPYLLNWLLFGVMSFALVAALYPQISSSHLAAVTGLFTAAWLVGYLAVFVPQGLVVRELFITGLLTALLGVPAPAAAAAALLSRLFSMLSVALWGAIGTKL